MLVQYSDDEDDGEAPVLTQDPASNVKVTVHIPPTQPPTTNNQDEEENYVNLDLLHGIKRPPIQTLTEGDKRDNSDSSDDEPTVKVINNKKQKIETCNAIMPTASKAGRYLLKLFNTTFLVFIFVGVMLIFICEFNFITLDIYPKKKERTLF